MSSDSSDDKTSKRKERLEQNRLSARESRKRKKVMIEELQRTLLTLSRENKELNEQNEDLRRTLISMASKYPNVIPIQSLLSITATDPVPMDSATRNDLSLEDIRNNTIMNNSGIPASTMFIPSGSLHASVSAPSNMIENTPLANMQPTDAALLANLLFRISGAPLSSAPFFLTPMVQRAAASAAAAATLSVAAAEQSHSNVESNSSCGSSGNGDAGKRAMGTHESEDTV